MKVYLDLVFFMNFAFDFLLLLTVSLVLKRHASYRRLLFGAFVGSISLVCLFLPMNSFTLFLFKIILSIIMILIAFGFHDRNTFIKNFGYLYFVSILLGGFLYFLNTQFSYKQEGLIFFFEGLSINIIFLFIASPIILFLYVKQTQKLVHFRKTNVQVDLYFEDGREYHVLGFIDTGNQLRDPYKKRSVVLLSLDSFQVPFEEAILVPYRTLDHTGIIRCMEAKRLVIDQKREYFHVLVGKSEKAFTIPGVDLILPNEYFHES